MIALKQFVYSIVHSLLGPNKNNKLIINSEETLISRCPWILFQKTVLREPLSCLFEETLFAHHNLHGCCTLTLLSMWYFWNSEFLCALDDGCKIKDIVTNAQNVLEKVVFSLSEISMNLDNLIKTKSTVDKITFNNLLNVPNCIPVSVRYSSRYFSPFSQNAFNLKDERGNFDKGCAELDEKCLHIIFGLDHDDDEEVSNLMSECWKRQRFFNKIIGFHTESLIVCPITLPSSCSCIIDGLILKSNSNQPSCQLLKHAYTNRALIINGSIAFEYTHLGISPNVSFAVKKIPSNLLFHEKEIWQKKCCELILKLHINMLLVKEHVDTEIAHFCFNHSILLLTHQPWSSLKIICYSLQHSPCTYILDCDETCILPNIAIHEWKPRAPSPEKYFVVDAKLNHLFQSIILCHPTVDILEMKVHQLGHFISRLKAVAESGKLLPGGGKAEKYCYQKLQELLLQEKESHKVRLIAAIADGFLNYSRLVFNKQKLALHSNNAYDIFTSKVSAWHSAMALACLTLQCDTSIINGIEDLDTVMKL